MMKNKTTILLIAALVFLTLGIRYGIKAYNLKTAPPQVQHSNEDVKLGGPFTLVDDTGKTVTEKDYSGSYMLVYFGYTFCPDVCPTGLTNIGTAMDMLSADQQAQVKPLFITVDPERDTVEAMGAYMQSFHSSITGLSGSREQVNVAIKAYKVYAAKVQDEASDDYAMDHSAYIFMMGPDGKYINHFTHKTTPDEMAKALKAVL